MNSTLKNLVLSFLLIGSVSQVLADEQLTFNCVSSDNENPQKELTVSLEPGGNPRVPIPAKVKFQANESVQYWAGSYVVTNWGLHQEYAFYASSAEGYPVQLNIVESTKVGRGGCGRGGCDQWSSTKNARLLVEGHEVFFGSCN